MISIDVSNFDVRVNIYWKTEEEKTESQKQYLCTSAICQESTSSDITQIA